MSSAPKAGEAVKWIQPEDGWTKINFDGASKGNTGPSGIGCVARDSNGGILMLEAKRI